MRGVEVVLGLVLAGAAAVTVVVWRGPASANGATTDRGNPVVEEIAAGESAPAGSASAHSSATPSARAEEEERPRPVYKTQDEGTAEGKAAAEADAAAGRLGWRTLGGWGLPARGGVDPVTLAEILERDFQVNVQRHEGGAGCMPPPDEPYQRALMDTYNATITPAMEARHGKGILAVARKRADAETHALEARLAACKGGSKAACDALDPETRSRNGIAEPIAPGDRGCNPIYTVDANGEKRMKPHCWPK